MLRRALDALVRPMVFDFSLREALRMNSADLLHGASAAAQTVSDAHGDALRGDNAALDALHEHGALHSSLHQRLCVLVAAASGGLRRRARLPSVIRAHLGKHGERFCWPERAATP